MLAYTLFAILQLKYLHSYSIVKLFMLNLKIFIQTKIKSNSIRNNYLSNAKNKIKI